jgi:hypothetical protein
MQQVHQGSKAVLCQLDQCRQANLKRQVISVSMQDVA